MPILALIGGLRGIVTALAASAATIALVGVYDKLIDDPAIAKAARQGFVVLAEKTALQASVAELKRQADARQDALEKFESRRIMAEAQAETRAALLEQEIAAYEAANSVCRLDRADIDFLSKP